MAQKKIPEDWFSLANEVSVERLPLGNIGMQEVSVDVSVQEIIKDCVDSQLCTHFTSFWTPFFPTAEELKRWKIGFLEERSAQKEVCEENECKKMLKLMEDMGEGMVWWVVWAEDKDSWCRWYSDPTFRKFESRKEAYQWYIRHLFQQPLLRYLKDKIPNWDKYYFMAAPRACFDVHYQFELGFKLCMVERGCALSGNQAGIAFLRGAAKQYGRYWGLHQSGGNRGWELYEEGRFYGGLSSSLNLRSFIVAYISGANMIYDEYFSYRGTYVDLGDGKLTKTVKWHDARKFADFSLRRHHNRGRTHVPVALMLDYYHGWDPGRNSCQRREVGGDVVWGCMPFEEGDYMLENFFDTAFPNGLIWPKAVPLEKDEPNRKQISQEPLTDAKVGPYSTKEELKEMLIRGFDYRAYEFKLLTESTWGDSFDVVLDNCPLEVLCQYPVVMLLGGIKTDDNLMDKLKEYVKQGGLLIINVRQLHTKGDEAFFGVKFMDRVEKSNRSKCLLCGEEYEEPRYTYQQVDIATARIEAVNDKGDPLIVRNSVGAGEVILTTPHYLQAYDPDKTETFAAEIYGLSQPVDEELRLREIHFSQFSEIGKDRITHVMDRFALARIEGAPIEYIVNRTEEGIIVTLVNNGECLWEGELRVDKPDGESIEVSEWWNDEECEFDLEGEKVIIRAQVPEFEFRIYGIGKFA